jgi:hypothetical protein
MSALNAFGQHREQGVSASQGMDQAIPRRLDRPPVGAGRLFLTIEVDNCGVDLVNVSGLHHRTVYPTIDRVAHVGHAPVVPLTRPTQRAFRQTVSCRSTTSPDETSLPISFSEATN